MALDKVVHNDLDVMEALEQRLDKDVDDLFKAINIDAVIEDSQKELLRFSDEVKELISEKYAQPSIEEGFNLAEEVKKTIKEDEKIEVSDSKDPNLNEDIVDDKV